MSMHQQMPMFYAEFAAPHSQPIAAADIKTAAAVAAAMGKSHGWKLLGVYAEATYDELVLERERGKSLGKA
jgi:hypothetical protein